jgi:hypothetical protein
MSGHRNVDDAATMMGQDHECEQQSMRDGRHDEEISCRDLMVAGWARPSCGTLRR